MNPISIPSFTRPEPRNRARELIDYTLGNYKWLKKQLKKDESINLVCFVGGRQFDVYQIGARSIDLLEVKGQNDDGTMFAAFAPVEQVCFTVILFKKTSAEPPREIGFHATAAEEKL